jgi:hypothetical protein
MSRALGDLDSGHYILPYPAIRQVLLCRPPVRLILASDGVWDAIESNRACAAIRSAATADAARLLVRKAIDQHKVHDDTSAVLLDYLGGPPGTPGTPLFKSVAKRFGRAIPRPTVTMRLDPATGEVFRVGSAGVASSSLASSTGNSPSGGGSLSHAAMSPTSAGGGMGGRKSSGLLGWICGADMSNVLSEEALDGGGGSAGGDSLHGGGALGGGGGADAALVIIAQVDAFLDFMGGRYCSVPEGRAALEVRLAAAAERVSPPGLGRKPTTPGGATPEDISLHGADSVAAHLAAIAVSAEERALQNVGSAKNLGSLTAPAGEAAGDAVA